MAVQGIVRAASVPNEIVNEVDVYARQVYVNEAPLYARLPRRVAPSETFSMGRKRVRGRAYTLGAAVADGSTTSVTLTDNTNILVGDVLELVSGERVEVTAVLASNVLTVRRGIEGTTAAAQSNSTAVVLIANSRTGGEVNQQAQRQDPSFVTQYVQTFQHPVQVGGKLQAMSQVRSDLGIQLPDAGDLVMNEKNTKLTELVLDVEYALYYQIGEAPGVGAGRAKMKGVRSLCSGAGTLTTSPVNASAYKVTDLIRDTVEKVYANGGRPDVLVISTNFLTGMAVWGQPTQNNSAGMTEFGLPIQELFAPFIPYPMAIIPSRQLKAFTAACLSTRNAENEESVRLRYIRQEQWQERGRAGDAVEGEWLADFAIDVDDPTQHAWVEGITGFSA